MNIKALEVQLQNANDEAKMYLDNWNFSKMTADNLRQERDRYRAALRRIVEGNESMPNGVHLGAVSCYRIALDALSNTNTFPPNGSAG